MMALLQQETFLHLSLTNVIGLVIIAGNLIWIVINSRREAALTAAIAKLEKHQATMVDGVKTSVAHQVETLRTDFDKRFTYLQKDLNEFRLETERNRREDQEKMRQWINGSFLRSDKVAIEMAGVVGKVGEVEEKIEHVENKLGELEREGCYRFRQQHLPKKND